MQILIFGLEFLALVLAVLLLAGLFMRREHYVQCRIEIDAPVSKVYEYIRFLKHQDEFNLNAQAGEERDKTYRGTDGTVGFVYAWKGDKKAGEGEKEIISLTPNESMVAELRFVKPMKTSSRIVFQTQALSPTRTLALWSNTGRLSYPFNILIPMLEKMMPKDMNASLGKLKEIVEAS